MSTPKCHSSKKNDRKPSCNQFVSFPEVIDERIDTNEFLTASRGVVKLIDKFGKLFAPVKYDMQGNIEKLSARYLTDTEVNATLQDMLMLEIAIGDSTTCTEALVWLTRGLHMIQLFFEKVVVDCKSRNGSEDLVAVLRKAYEGSLEPYHGWMAKQLFGLLSRMVPTRTDLLQALSDDVPGKEEATIVNLEEFTRGLKSNIAALHVFFAERDRKYFIQKHVS